MMPGMHGSAAAPDSHNGGPARSDERPSVFVCGPFTALIDADTGVVPENARWPLIRVIEHFERGGFEVLSAHRIEGWGAVEATAEDCTGRDFDWITAADVIVAFPGAPASPGTHVEIGWASALRRPLVLVLEPGEQHALLVLGLGRLCEAQYVSYAESDLFLEHLDEAVDRAISSVKTAATSLGTT